jgi:hypothetical protein
LSFCRSCIKPLWQFGEIGHVHCVMSSQPWVGYIISGSVWCLSSSPLCSFQCASLNCHFSLCSPEKQNQQGFVCVWVCVHAHLPTMCVYKKRFVMRSWLMHYGGQDIPVPIVGKLETQEIWWYSSSLRPNPENQASQSYKFQSKFKSKRKLILQLEVKDKENSNSLTHLFVLLKPSVDLMRPCHIKGSKLHCSVYFFRC